MTARWSGHLRLAHDLKQPLHELLGWRGPMTHRQYAAWHAWLEEQWDRPARGDYYLMQVALQVSRVLARNPERIKMEHFQLRFADPAAIAARPARDPAAAEQHRRNQVAWSKSKWLGAMRGEIEQRTISRQEAIEQGFLQVGDRGLPGLTGATDGQ